MEDFLSLIRICISYMSDDPRDVDEILDSSTDPLDNQFQRLEYEVALRDYASAIERNGGRWVTNPPTYWDRCDKCGRYFMMDKIIHIGVFDYCTTCAP